MKKQVLFFVAVVICVVVVVFTSRQEMGGQFLTAGGGGFSLKEMNDTTKSSVVAMAQANTTSEESLAQVLTIGSWEKNKGSFFIGADLLGTVSTQFGVMCPTYDVRTGVDFNAFRLEAKVGNFTRNSVTVAGFDPQYSNFCTLAGQGASVSNAVQVSVIANGTKVYAGHQGGSKFYQFDDGNYYVGAEQRIGGVAISGGVNFTENVTGYAALKWKTRHDEITLNGNQLGGPSQNFILSYMHVGIPVCKGISMNFGGSFWSQTEKKGVQLVSGFSKGKVTLFAEAGGYKAKTFKPVWGLGVDMKL